MFEDKPCISDLKKLFKGLLIKKGAESDFQFDWIRKKIPKEITFQEQETAEVRFWILNSINCDI